MNPSEKSSFLNDVSENSDGQKISVIYCFYFNYLGMMNTVRIKRPEVRLSFGARTKPYPISFRVHVAVRFVRAAFLGKISNIGYRIMIERGTTIKRFIVHRVHVLCRNVAYHYGQTSPAAMLSPG